MAFRLIVLWEKNFSKYVFPNIWCSIKSAFSSVFVRKYFHWNVTYYNFQPPKNPSSPSWSANSLFHRFHGEHPSRWQDSGRPTANMVTISKLGKNSNSGNLMEAYGPNLVFNCLLIASIPLFSIWVFFVHFQEQEINISMLGSTAKLAYENLTLKLWNSCSWFGDFLLYKK